jgi:hypothetical protein
VADVLHSWPEYWDSELGVWIGVDPTWGHTTGGIDYFEKLDLKHFTFAIHGLHDNKPYAAGSYKLGPNPQKDVYVRFGQLPTERGGEIEINASIRNLFNPFKKMLYADFTNVGKSSLTGIFPSIYYDNEKVREDYIVTLPPFSKHNLRNEISYGLFAKNAPNNISIYASEKEVIIKSKKFEVISMQLIIFFTILLATIIMVLVKIGKLRINMSSYLSNIKHFAYENIIKKITKISPKKR